MSKRPVREPGEAVVQRIVGEPFFGLHDVGDVTQDPEDLHDRTVDRHAGRARRAD